MFNCSNLFSKFNNILQNILIKWRVLCGLACFGASSSVVLCSTSKPQSKCRKVTSSNTSHLEAHADHFRLLLKGIFDPYIW